MARLTATQKEILLFLGTGGPAYIASGSRRTRCGSVTSGDRWVYTNSATVWFLHQNDLVVRVNERGDLVDANRENPLVARLLARS